MQDLLARGRLREVSLRVTKRRSRHVSEVTNRGEGALPHGDTDDIRTAISAAGMCVWQWDIATGAVAWSPGLEDLRDASGEYHSFTRDGAIPKVEVDDPLNAHKAMLPQYKDADIHNVTAYLVSLK